MFARRKAPAPSPLRQQAGARVAQRLDANPAVVRAEVPGVGSRFDAIVDDRL